MKERNKNNGSTSSRVPVILFGIIILFLSLGIVAVISLFLYFYFSNLTQPGLTQPKTLQYMEIDPNGKRKTIYGFVELERDLQEGEFISYPNEESGKYVFISQFSNKKYECKGTCFCRSSENERRSSSTLLTRSLVLLISAFSTPVAIQMAQKSFEHSCKSNFYDFCEEDKIMGSVSECEEMANMDDIEEGRDGPDEIKYMCSGNCMKNEEYIELERVRYQQLPKCDKLKYEVSKVSIRTTVDESFFQKDVEMCSGYEKQAKEKFFTFFLQPFCKSSSNVMGERGVFSCDGDMESVNCVWVRFVGKDGKIIKNENT